ncbi:hypothetical protein M4S82_11180 [Planococcus sp. MERTA32b]|nr:hypothetical protein [Planococcus sp. MER TA 32b]
MKRLMILVFFTSLFMVPIQSSALSCPEPSSVAVEYDEYDAVLIGTVVEIESNNTNKRLTIEVAKSFKGADKKTVTVSEDVTWGESQENGTYLFFLKKEGEKWYHPLCSPTTHNTNLAAEHFTDEEEITLHEVPGVSGVSTNTPLILLTGILLTVVIAGISIRMVNRRNKIQ